MSMHVESSLPEGWVPDGAVVHVLARRYPDGHWESVVPEFGIAGMGDSADAAYVNAIELLDDYLGLVARAGRSFEGAYRPAGLGTRLAMLFDVLALLVRSKLRRPRADRNSRRYRVPLHPLGAH